MTPPPPPAYPPTVGQPDSQPQPDPQPDVVQWVWRRNWAPRQRTTGPALVDLRKRDDAPDGEQHEADDQPDSGAGEPDPAAPAWVDTLAERLGTHLGTIISETPEERAERLRSERDAMHEAAGETDSERKARHRREAIARRHRASVLWRQPQSERARRFRRWCILTAVSASIGFAVHLPQALTGLPLPVGAGVLVGSWLLDVKLRGGGHVRVTQVRGAVALTYLCIVRVPVASAFVAVLGLSPLLTLLNTGH